MSTNTTINDENPTSTKQVVDVFVQNLFQKRRDKLMRERRNNWVKEVVDKRPIVIHF